MKDYYKILGVSKDATDDEIRKAYRDLCLKFHPDRNQGLDLSAVMAEINEAYEALKGKGHSHNNTHNDFDSKKTSDVNTSPQIRIHKVWATSTRCYLYIHTSFTAINMFDKGGAINVWVSNEDGRYSASFLASKKFHPNSPLYVDEDFCFRVSLNRVSDTLNQSEGWAKIHVAFYEIHERNSNELASLDNIVFYYSNVEDEDDTDEDGNINTMNWKKLATWIGVSWIAILILGALLENKTHNNHIADFVDNDTIEITGDMVAEASPIIESQSPYIEIKKVWTTQQNSYLYIHTYFSVKNMLNKTGKMNVWISNEKDPTNDAPFLTSETYTPNYQDCYYEDFSFGVSLEKISTILKKLEGDAMIHIALYDDNNVMLAHSYDIETYFRYTDIAKQQVYAQGKQKGYYDGVNDGYYENSEINLLGVLPPASKGRRYNRSCDYDDFELSGAYMKGYDSGYDYGLQVGYSQRLAEYNRKRAELEQKRKEWDEKYGDEYSHGGLFDKDGNFLPPRP